MVGLSAMPCAAQVERASKSSGAARSASVDLDGDGKKESIRLAPASNREEEGRYRLWVGSQPISGALDGMAGLSFYIIDIDRADRYKEIVVQQDDLALNFDSKIYWFDGRALRLAGSISGIEALYKGDGVVSEQRWRVFWTSTDTYRLNRARKLVKTPRLFYAVNKKATVDKSLPLRGTRGSSKTKATLQVGTKVTVVKSDLKGWFLVRAQNGTQGWVAQNELLDGTQGLPVGD